MRQDHAMKIPASLLFAALLAAAAPPFAQEPKPGIATLKSVQGNVLVSGESGLASGDESLRLVEGTRVITTANAEVIVAYDNGCEVRLKENQRFEVETGKPCSALVAQAASILAEPAGMAAAGGATGLAAFSATLPAIGGGLTGLGVIQTLRERASVSPS